MNNKFTTAKLAVSACLIIVSIVLFVATQFGAANLNTLLSFSPTFGPSTVSELLVAGRGGTGSAAKTISAVTDDNSSFRFASLRQNTDLVQMDSSLNEMSEVAQLPTGISGEVKFRIDEETSLPIDQKLAKTLLVEISNSKNGQVVHVESLLVDDLGMFATFELENGDYDVSVFQIDIERKTFLAKESVTILAGHVIPINLYLDMASIAILDDSDGSISPHSSDSVAAKEMGSYKNFLPFVGNMENRFSDVELTIKEQLSAASVMTSCPSTIPCAQGMPFTVTSSNPPGSVTMTAPTGSTASTTPVYTWNEEAAATTYRVWIYDLSPFTLIHNAYYDASNVCTNGICSVTVAGLTLSPGDYRWYIRPINSAGNGPHTYLNFAVSSGVPGPVTQILPSGATASTTPVYTWNEDSSATSYYVWIYDLSPFTLIHNVYYDASAVCSNGVCSVTPSGLTLTPGAHRWYVRPINSAGNGPHSYLNFTVSGSTPGPVTLITPSSATTASTTPVYTWNEDSSATSYYVWIYDLSPFTLIHNVYYDASTVCSNGVCSVTPTGLTLTPGAHRWYVRPINSFGNGPHAYLNFVVE